MTMREAALALARKGFAVFPIKPGAKSPPLVMSWQHAATTDEAQVTKWWTSWPEANIGVHCAGLLVIDVDVKKGGYESLEALEAEIQLEATYEVETPTGGRHIYYRLGAEDVRNGVDVLGDGIDIRSRAGYVLGAGSRTGVGEYRVVADEPIAPVDPQIVERCRVVVAEQRDTQVVGSAIEVDENEAVMRARDFLRGQPGAVEGQGGDLRTYQVICRVRDFGVPILRAAEALNEWNARCTPPWGEEEFEAKIRNAYKYAQAPAGKLSIEALQFQPVAGAVPVEPPAEIPIAPAPPPEARSLPSSMPHPSELTLDDLVDAKYLVKGVLDRQSNVVVFGHWNVGKTFVVLDMAASIACGLPWFGRRVHQGKVLYLGYEGIRAMKKRIIALRDKFPGLKDINTPFRWTALRHPLTQPAGHNELVEALELFAQKHGGAPDLVIIDPLANALGGDDADAMVMAALNTKVSEIMDRQRCTVLRVHHSGHSNTDRARGHSSLPAGVDTEIRIDESEIVMTKQRDDVRGKMAFNLKVVTLCMDRDGDAVTTCVIEQIDENAMSPELTTAQQSLLDYLISTHGDGAAVTKSDVACHFDKGFDLTKKREIIAALVRKKYLRPEGKGYVICERGSMDVFDHPKD